jgi:uncharacterized phage protein (predicted DNA packaging)
MKNSVMIALRISHSMFDTEIEDLISAARLDLIQSGISADKANLNNDALIKRAIITYCKAHFLANKDEAERFQNSYDLLKTHLSLADDYREVVIIDDVE